MSNANELICKRIEAQRKDKEQAEKLKTLILKLDEIQVSFDKAETNEQKICVVSEAQEIVEAEIVFWNNKLTELFEGEELTDFLLEELINENLKNMESVMLNLRQLMVELVNS